MKSNTLIKMLKQTNKQYGSGIKEEDIDTIIDWCDDNYEEELKKIVEAQRRVNNVFIKALGIQKFNEINKDMK